MFAHSFLICVLVGSILQTSLCQETETGYGVKDGSVVKGGGTETDTAGTESDTAGTESDTAGTETDTAETETGYGVKDGSVVKGGGTETDTAAPVTLPEEMVNQYKESITWDAQTANPRIVLSGDLKTVTLSNISQNVDNNTERFDKDPSVLSSAGYQSGKHYWVVGGNGGWLVGVAAQSVRRKGYLDLDPSAGIYAMAKPINEGPAKTGIFLDCDELQVSILDADSRVVLFKFDINPTEPIHLFTLIGVGSLTVE